MHWVFAYGSNMHLPDLERWLRNHAPGVGMPPRVEPARLPGYELSWNYRSVARRGGAANVRPRPGAELRGLALGMDDDLLAALDRKEGHPHRYCRGDAPIPVQLLRTSASADAWLYRVTPAHETASAVAPRADYLRLLIEAAREHDLGEDYVRGLQAIAAAAPSETS